MFSWQKGEQSRDERSNFIISCSSSSLPSWYRPLVQLFFCRPVQAAVGCWQPTSVQSTTDMINPVFPHCKSSWTFQAAASLSPTLYFDMSHLSTIPKKTSKESLIVSRLMLGMTLLFKPKSYLYNVCHKRHGFYWSAVQNDKATVS